MLLRSRRLAMLALLLTTACGPRPLKTYPIMPAAVVPIDQAHDRSNAFGKVFCATLQHFQDPDGRPWGDCARYLPRASMSTPVSSTLASRFPLLLAGGLGDSCLAGNASTFAGAIVHLREAHQVEVETVRTPPFASSSENGRTIARAITDHWMADPAHRPYVLVGYSKGAADLLEAIADLPMPREQVAALVTVAGLVNGTLVDGGLNPFFEARRPWTDRHCPMNDDHLSLTPHVRHDFLRQHPLLVPAYSLVAISTERETSPLLRGSWARLNPYAAEHDGFVVAWDAVLPGAAYLGAARADHVAIALAMDDGKKRKSKAGDPGRFPREALFEAIVRYVTDDVRARPAAQ